MTTETDRKVLFFPWLPNIHAGISRNTEATRSKVLPVDNKCLVKKIKCLFFISK